MKTTIRSLIKYIVLFMGSSLLTAIFTTATKALPSETDYIKLAQINQTQPMSMPKKVSQRSIKLTTTMTAEQFETWVNLNCDRLRDMRKPPDIPQKELLNRLRAGQYVTDDTVITVVSASEAADTILTPPGSAAHVQLTNTFRLIDIVLGFTYGRPSLAAKLHQHKAELYSNANDLASAIREYAAAESLLTPLHVAVDRERINSLVQEADELYLSGKPQQAEPLYLEALSYEWYKVADSESQHLLKDLYLQAGRGLILCRRGNLVALKEIYFVPSTRDELGPDLQQAIKEAEGTKTLSPTTTK